MAIRAYLDWNEVLFARAYSGKGHFLDLIHIQQQNIGCFIFVIYFWDILIWDTGRYPANEPELFPWR